MVYRGTHDYLWIVELMFSDATKIIQWKIENVKVPKATDSVINQSAKIQFPLDKQFFERALKSSAKSVRTPHHR